MSAPPPNAENRTTGGLRERKKAKTKLAIQEHAIQLFRAQGYSATTMDQIAAAAEVSPSTVFRYFASKEDLVTTDEVDPVIYAAFEEQPSELSLLGAWRGALTLAFSRLTQAELETERGRGLLVLSVPELWAASLGHIDAGIDTMVELSARRVGRDPSDLELRATVGSMFGVLLVVAFDWLKGPEFDIVDRMDQAMAHLESGTTL